MKRPTHIYIRFLIDDLDPETCAELRIPEGTDSDSWTSKQYAAACDYFDLPHSSTPVSIPRRALAEIAEYEEEEGTEMDEDSVISCILDALSDDYGWLISSVEFVPND